MTVPVGGWGSITAVLEKLRQKKNEIKLSNHEDQMSLNSNSTYQLCSELNQTYQRNELTQ